MSGFEFSPDQEAALSSTGRITLVKAGPGSGKTRVFVEFLRRHLENWSNKPGGIAALSFTNVASEVIKERLGGEPHGPHFVGTLDSFFLRFVVGPFGHLAGITRSGPRLVPSPLNEELREPAIDLLPLQSPRLRAVPLLAIEPWKGDEQSPHFRVRTRGRWQVIPESHARHVLKAKQKEWRSKGRINHADSHYLASVLLNGQHQERIRSILARRFPLILVDELQDTGHFLRRALLALLSEPLISGVLVGDPDQGIFGFSGANRGIFDEIAALEGCETYELRTTYRCSKSICTVASALTRSGASVEPVRGAADGKAVLLVHAEEHPSSSSHVLERAIELAKSSGCRTLAVLTRRHHEKRRSCSLCG